MPFLAKLWTMDGFSPLQRLDRAAWSCWLLSSSSVSCALNSLCAPCNVAHTTMKFYIHFEDASRAVTTKFEWLEAHNRPTVSDVISAFVELFNDSNPDAPLIPGNVVFTTEDGVQLEPGAACKMSIHNGDDIFAKVQEGYVLQALPSLH